MSFDFVDTMKFLSDAILGAFGVPEKVIKPEGEPLSEPASPPRVSDVLVMHQVFETECPEVLLERRIPPTSPPPIDWVLAVERRFKLDQRLAEMAVRTFMYFHPWIDLEQAIALDLVNLFISYSYYRRSTGEREQYCSSIRLQLKSDGLSPLIQLRREDEDDQP